jgi:hypothetical protein
MLVLPHGLRPATGRGEAMKDLKADWRKWSGVERFSAALGALLVSGILPVLLRLGRLPI